MFDEFAPEEFALDEEVEGGADLEPSEDDLEDEDSEPDVESMDDEDEL